MGILKTLTKEYFGEIEREEEKIDGVEENHEFTDKNGKFHEKGFFITNGENKILRKLVLKLVKQRGPDADLNDIDVSNIKDMSKIFEPINPAPPVSKNDFFVFFRYSLISSNFVLIKFLFALLTCNF